MSRPRKPDKSKTTKRQEAHSLGNQHMPLACLVDAIPEHERSAHFRLASELFGHQAEERKDVPNGYAFRFSPDTLEQVARFLSNERRCCPFLSFEIAIASGGGPLWLHITGPDGAREFLAAELPSVVRDQQPS